MASTVDPVDPVDPVSCRSNKLEAPPAPEFLAITVLRSEPIDSTSEVLQGALNLRSRRQTYMEKKGRKRCLRSLWVCFSSRPSETSGVLC